MQTTLSLKYKRLQSLLFLAALLSYTITSAQTVKTTENKQSDIHYFIDLIYTKDTALQNQHLIYIAENWQEAFEVMVLELAYFNADNDLGVRLMDLLNEKTGQPLGYSINTWYEYLWAKPAQTLPQYDYFKGELYRQIDKRFERYFVGRQKTSDIRFDEIRWGGVEQDGIPPLRNPAMITVAEADYLADSDVVFGIAINGDFRAYPKRILAWHEMFIAIVGGEAVTGVYCTLCGTVIIYKSTKDSVTYELGTSGFLFRSNKLMYDKATQSLWNTVWGKPVVGSLVGQGIQLDYLSVVTTTWGEWKKRHPTTTVLSLSTGYERNYDEGVAYRAYFADDNLMFAVPPLKKEKIRNKQSILAIRLQGDTTATPVAISTKFLKKNPVYHHQIGPTSLLVLTDKSAANRAYDIGDRQFAKYNRSNNIVSDSKGDKWTVHETHLKNEKGEILPRFQAFNAFWFGWQAAYPNTVLVR